MTNLSSTQNHSTRRRAIAIGAAGLAAMAWSWGYAAHEHGQDGGKGKSEEQSGGGHEGDGGKGKMQGHMMHDAGPGAVEQVCHDMGKHPPHFCEPGYKAASSVPGVRVADVDPAGEREVVVKLRELNVQSPGVAQKLVIVAGGGDLAGAAVVDAGWKQEKTVNVKLNGNGSIYLHRLVHVHIFPLTGP